MTIQEERAALVKRLEEIEAEIAGLDVGACI